MPNSWIKKAYVQVFGCEYITFKKVVNIFECMEISEPICEGVVEPSYIKTTMENSNRAGRIRKNIGGVSLSQTHSATIERSPRRVRDMASVENDM